MCSSNRFRSAEGRLSSVTNKDGNYFNEQKRGEGRKDDSKGGRAARERIKRGNYKLYNKRDHFMTVSRHSKRRLLGLILRCSGVETLIALRVPLDPNVLDDDVTEL
jgi:hypothetical protein